MPVAGKQVAARFVEAGLKVISYRYQGKSGVGVVAGVAFDNPPHRRNQLLIMLLHRQLFSVRSRCLFLSPALLWPRSRH